MKIIGLIGGTTWVSTQEYYRIINETVNKKLGKSHSARCILYSVDFEETIIKQMNNWDKLANDLVIIAKKLEKSGADVVLICANTLHKVFEDIEKNISIPVIHIADVTGKKIVQKGIKKVGLLGTKITMREKFYKDRLKSKFDVDTIVPEKDDIDFIHHVIIDEIAHEKYKKSSKKKYIKIIDDLVLKGAEGIILGCTEIPLLISQKDIDVPVFDTTSIHAKAAVDYIL